MPNSLALKEGVGTGVDFVTFINAICDAKIPVNFEDRIDQAGKIDQINGVKVYTFQSV